MKKKFLGVALLGSALFASNVGNCNCSNFAAAVELLYWKPMHDPIFWARLSNRPTPGSTPPYERKEFYLTGDWDPGVRVHFGYETPCFFTDLSYLYFSNLEKDSVDRDGFDKLEIQGSPPFQGSDTQDEAKASAKFRYQNIDGRIGYHFYSTCDRDLFVYGNGRWLRIDFRNLTQGRFEDTTFFGDYFDQHMRFNGGGFGLGIGGHSSLFCGLGFNGSIGVMGIVGETFIQNLSDNNSSRSPGPFFLASDESWWHIIPAVDFHFGLDYEFCICKHVLIFEAAYELQYYFNVMRFVSTNVMPGPDSERIPPLTNQNVGFGGPLLKLTMVF